MFPRTKTATIALLCILSLPCFLYAKDKASESFTQANALYEKGQFNDAIAMYHTLITQGNFNTELYYNLGNAYYKNQQIGYALVYFEKALRLSPRDPDIRYNIDFIATILKQPLPSFMEHMISSVLMAASLNEMLVFTLMCYLCLITVFLYSIVSKKRLFSLLNVSFFFIFLVLVLILALKIRNEVLTTWAVVITGPAEVRNGPGFENSIGFTLPEGRKVFVLGEKDEWVAIGLQHEGLKGWLEKKYIKNI